jgi:hypothetical protein
MQTAELVKRNCWGFAIIAHAATFARRPGNAHAVSARKFRAATNNPCDTVVAEFFGMS